MAVPRAMSASVFPEEEPEYDNLEERDTGLCASLSGEELCGVQISRVAMNGYSDHEMVDVEFHEWGICATSWNTGMTGKDPSAGPDMMSAQVSPELEVVLARIMVMSVADLLKEALSDGMTPEFRLRIETAAHFIAGFDGDTPIPLSECTIRQCDTATRFVSQIAQGNCFHAILQEVANHITFGSTPQDAVLAGLSHFKFGPKCYWQPHHNLPISKVTNERVAVDDEAQARANVYLYMFIFAKAMLEEAVHFDCALRTAKKAPDNRYIIGKLCTSLHPGVQVIGLQELTGDMIEGLRCAMPDFTVYGGAYAKPHCAVLVRKYLESEPLPLGLEKGVDNRAAAALVTAPSGVIAVLSIHGDANGLTIKVLDAFRDKCAERGIDRVIVLGDLQIAKIKHPNPHAECQRIVETALGVPVAMAEPIGTRLPTPKSYFDPQFKHFPA